MMSYVFLGMVFLSVVFGFLTGRMGEVSNAALDGGMQAVTLSIKLMGAMCLWSGVMKIAERSGLTKKLAKLLSPILKLLFRGIKPDSKAAQAISMNMIANFLGLGNAATPLGISAMKELSKVSLETGTASNHMVTFVVLNTASIQLIPTTIATLRLAHGSAAPMEILPAVWLCSALSVTVGIFMAKVLAKKEEPCYAKHR
ncbi:MAG TPA: spore maturation protein A [Firmicutes bacterium]|nr:spore maturation protein A [Bacillota bacterium]